MSIAPRCSGVFRRLFVHPVSYALGAVLLLSLVALPLPVQAIGGDDAPAITATDKATEDAIRALHAEALEMRAEILKNSVRDQVIATNAYNQARQYAGQGSWQSAANLMRKAINARSREPNRWLDLSTYYSNTNESDRRALLAAYLHALEGKTSQEQAEGYARAGDFLMRADEKKMALSFFEAAKGLQPSDSIQAAIDSLNGKTMVLLDSRVEPDRNLARVCLRLSNPISKDKSVHLSDYVEVEPRVETTVSVTGKEICVEGLPHGESSTITLKPGFPGAAGERLYQPIVVSQTVSNRAPRTTFTSNAYILPIRGPQDIAVRTINVVELNLSLSRVNDRALATLLRERTLTSTLSGYDVSEITDSLGEPVWSGKLSIEAGRKDNQEVATAINLSDILKEPKPGLYLLSGEDAHGDLSRWQDRPFQWILLTDIGLQTAKGPNGLNVFARSLETAKPMKGIRLLLIASNNEELGTAVTDDQGMAVFPPGLLTGAHGRAAAYVMAYGEKTDFSYLDIKGPAFDLSDRGVSGRRAPGPIDGYLYTDRGIYRPGETVRLVSLLRDDRSMALDGLALTLKVFRPDGVQAGQYVVKDSTGGAYDLDLPTLASGPTGSWEVRAYIDPTGDPVGQVRYLLDDFAPLTMELALKAETPTLDLTSDEPAGISVQADYLYGAPVQKGWVKSAVTLSVDPQPFEAFKDFSFGLTQETFETRRIDLDKTTTDATGHARVEVILGADNHPDSSHPVRALVRTEVGDESGQAVARTLVLPVRTQPMLVGVRKAFEGDEVEEGQAAAFDLLAVSNDGTPLEDHGLNWTLINEYRDYVWFSSDGTWGYRMVVNEKPVASGTIKTGSNGIVRISQPVDWGNYRLEVTDDSGSVAAASVRFHAGWWVSQGTEKDTPDTLKVTAEKASYKAGETARIHLSAPFAGEVMVQVVNEGVLSVQSLSLPKSGTTIDVPVSADWGVGAYVVATAYRPLKEEDANGSKKRSPQEPTRAMGLVWIPVDDPVRTLNLALEPPQRIRPQTTLQVPVTVANANGQPVVVTVAAIDEGILQLTDFVSPNPSDWYLGKRMLAFDYRDAYGRLLQPVDARPGRLREGGDASSRGLAGLPESSVKTVSLFSGLVKLDADGKGVVSFDVPDFNGRLRLMAVASSPKGIGQAEASVFVRDPVVALASLPRFLAPGDTSTMTISLDNAEAPKGPWTVKVEADNGVVASGKSTQTVTLAQKGRAVVRVPLSGDFPSTGRVRMTLSGAGPGGEPFARTSEWTMGVRPASPRVTTVHSLDLAPDKTGRFDGNLLDPYDERTAILGLDLSTIPNLKPLSHVAALERYSYACLEQTTSRGYAALYADDLGADKFREPGSRDPHDTLVWAVNRIVSLQRADGGFSLWESGGSLEPWLTAYATDFLLQAREKGTVAVPDFALKRALKFMQRQVLDNDFSTSRLQTMAYYHYVLAKAGADDLAQVRYFQDVAGDRLPTLLSRTHIAAALTLLGDKSRAATAFSPSGDPKAVSAPGSFGDAVRMEAAMAADFGDSPIYWNYGSSIRDQAATLAIGIETKLPGFDVFKVAEALALAQNGYSSFSTQEQAWIIRASHALASYQGTLDLTLNGEQIKGDRMTRSMKISAADLKAGLSLVNTGKRLVRVALTIDGQQIAPVPESENGLHLTRTYHTLTGKPVDPATVTQNDMVVAVIKGWVSEPKVLNPNGTPVLVVDLLPAGVVISNPAFGAGQDTKGLEWLGELTQTEHVESRDDRYAAGLKLTPSKFTFTLAYVVRATMPGDYVLPGVSGELMDRTFIRGNQGAQRLIVKGAK